MRRKGEDATPAAGAAVPDQPDAAGAQPVGVPPFRPATKEPPAMSRPPFPATPQSGAAPVPVASARANPAPRSVERRTLIVGKGIALHGTIQDAERLVVEGVIESAKIEATELSVALGGVFRGECVVEDADIAGVFDGTLTARGTLTVRGSGKVIGVARCGRLQVEDGGQISGQIEMLSAARPPEVARPDPQA